MVVSFCKYESNKYCNLLKTDCEPGRKGCVLIKGRFRITDGPVKKSKFKSEKQ